MPVEKRSFERILAVLKALTVNGHIKRDSFMRECKISPRTFDRLIEDLRFYIPIKYDHVKGLYTIDRTQTERRSDMLEYYKKTVIKDDFVLFYAFVRSMIASRYFFPPFSTDAGTSSQPKDFGRILTMLKELVTPADRAVYDKVEYYLSSHYKLNNSSHYKDVIQRILNSFQTECLMEFSYFRARVKAMPLKLVYYNGKWYMIAYVISSGNMPEKDWGIVRTYRVAHIKKSALLHGEYFPEVEIPEYSFNKSFGIYMDEDIKKAVVNLYGTAADDALEIVWHESQFTQTLTGKDGKKYAEISIDYPEHGSVELVSRVLSYGINAEIVSPPELRKIWLDDIKAMSKKFIGK